MIKSVNNEETRKKTTRDPGEVVKVDVLPTGGPDLPPPTNPVTGLTYVAPPNEVKAWEIALQNPKIKKLWKPNAK